MPEYLPVDAITRPGFTEDFYSGVLAEVTAALIARGVLQLGIEPLVYGQQGWAFAAVLVIRVHWFKTADAELAESFARDASRRLKTRAVAAFDDDVSGSYAQEWAGGKPGVEWSSNDDGFYLGFYERGIAGPSSWPGVMDGRHAFFSHTPEAIERVDYLGITEPARKEHPGMKKITVTPDSGMTAGDLLAQFAKAMGAPVGETTKKTPRSAARKKPAGPKPSRKNPSKRAVKPAKSAKSTKAVKVAKKRKGK